MVLGSIIIDLALPEKMLCCFLNTHMFKKEAYYVIIEQIWNLKYNRHGLAQFDMKDTGPILFNIEQVSLIQTLNKL